MLLIYRNSGHRSRSRSRDKHDRHRDDDNHRRHARDKGKHKIYNRKIRIIKNCIAFLGNRDHRSSSHHNRRRHRSRSRSHK